MVNADKTALDDAPDPFYGFLGYHLRRLSVIVMADLAEALKPLRLRPTEASILLVIASRSGATQSDIGRSLGIQRANMAPLIATLFKQSLLERKAVDGRSQALRLSAKGLALSRRLKQTIKDHEDRLFGALRPAVREQMINEVRSLWTEHYQGVATAKV